MSDMIFNSIAAAFCIFMSIRRIRLLNIYSYILEHGETVRGRRVWDTRLWKGLTVITGQGGMAEVKYHGRLIRVYPLAQPYSVDEKNPDIISDIAYRYHPDFPSYCCMADDSLKSRYFIGGIVFITLVSIMGIYYALPVISSIIR